VELVIQYISVAGCFALAISGALTAMHNRFDPFGVLIIGFVTAVGGGTIRDTLIADRDVFWFYDPYTLYAVVAGVVLAILLRKRIKYLNKPLLVFDTLGLGLFTVTGIQIGLDHDLHPLICLILGTITGSFGGVLRDILVNEVPVIFKKEVYATVSLAGGGLYLLLHHFASDATWPSLVAAAFIMLLRYVVVKFKIGLPNLYGKDILKKE